MKPFAERAALLTEDDMKYLLSCAGTATHEALTVLQQSMPLDIMKRLMVVPDENGNVKDDALTDRFTSAEIAALVLTLGMAEAYLTPTPEAVEHFGGPVNHREIFEFVQDKKASLVKSNYEMNKEVLKAQYASLASNGCACVKCVGARENIVRTAKALNISLTDEN